MKSNAAYVGCAVALALNAFVLSERRDPDVIPSGPISLDVDATDVERGIFRVSEMIPVTRAGPFTLLFPKWVPGNHAPTARIERLAGLEIRAGKRRLDWIRAPG